MSEENVSPEPITAVPYDEAAVNALSKTYRHICFAIFGGLAFLLAAFVFYTAIAGVCSGEIYDPFTDSKVLSE